MSKPQDKEDEYTHIVGQNSTALWAQMHHVGGQESARAITAGRATLDQQQLTVFRVRDVPW
jgi:hypothetical protein